MLDQSLKPECFADGAPQHSRQNSRDSQRSRLSRQNSREASAQHSRQGSRDASSGDLADQTAAETLAQTVEKLQKTSSGKDLSAVDTSLSGSLRETESAASGNVQNNIEIYATLPKKKGKKLSGDKLSLAAPVVPLKSSDVDKKSKDKKGSDKKDKNKEKRKGKQDDSDYSSDISNKNSPARKGTDAKTSDSNCDNSEEKPVGKKQHKIRRKLLMGGLIRRKNRSMPDLREGQEDEKQNFQEIEVRSLSRPTTPSEKSMAGYLSEGHMEYSANPNLERSKLMRKSFHGSVGKGLPPPANATKVPPPIPQRTSSQLSSGDGRAGDSEYRPSHPLPQNPEAPPALPPRSFTPDLSSNTNNINLKKEPQSLPYNSSLHQYDNIEPPMQAPLNRKLSSDGHGYSQTCVEPNVRISHPTDNQMTVQADVHGEPAADSQQYDRNQYNGGLPHANQFNSNFTQPSIVNNNGGVTSNQFSYSAHHQNLNNGVAQQNSYEVNSMQSQQYYNNQYNNNVHRNHDNNIQNSVNEEHLNDRPPTRQQYNDYSQQQYPSQQFHQYQEQQYNNNSHPANEVSGQYSVDSRTSGVSESHNSTNNTNITNNTKQTNNSNHNVDTQQSSGNSAVNHSRQGSEDFPPPPPPLEEAVEDLKSRGLLPPSNSSQLATNPATSHPTNHTNNASDESSSNSERGSSLLAQLQEKKQRLTSNQSRGPVGYQTNSMERDKSGSGKRYAMSSSGSNWLQELQAKQAALRRRHNSTSSDGDNVPVNQRSSDDASSVKNLTNKFEKTSISEGVDEVDCAPPMQATQTVSVIRTKETTERKIDPELFNREYTQCNSLTFPSQSGQVSRQMNSNGSRQRPETAESGILKQNSTSVLRSEPSETGILKQISTPILTRREHPDNGSGTNFQEEPKKKMKKSVTFCDQVILVATAEDEEDDAYIPNPILERVLKSAMTSSSPTGAESPALKRAASVEETTSKTTDEVNTSIESSASRTNSESGPVSTRINSQLQGTRGPPTAPQYRAPPPYQPPPNPNLPNGRVITNGVPASHMMPPPHNYSANVNKNPNFSKDMTKQPQNGPYQHPPPPASMPSNSGQFSSSNSNNRHPNMPQYQPPPHPHTIQMRQQQQSQQQQQQQSQQHYPAAQQSQQQHQQYAQQQGHHQYQQQQMQSQKEPQSQGPPQHRVLRPDGQLNSSIEQGPSRGPVMTRQNSNLGDPHRQFDGIPPQQMPPYQKVPYNPHMKQEQTRSNSTASSSQPSGRYGPPQSRVSSQVPQGYGSVGRGGVTVGQRPPQQHTQNSYPPPPSNSSSNPPPSQPGPGHFAGPLDPNAIYSTVNKGAKKTPSPNSNVSPSAAASVAAAAAPKTAIQACNLCHKKAVSPPSVYCFDCNFYMSRFKPKS